MKKISLLAGTAAIAMILFVSAPASAQSETQTTDNGTGFYVGGFGGYGWTDAETAGTDLSIDGGDYGVFAGFELTDWFARNNWGLTGAVEAHYAWSTADDDAGVVSMEKDNEWGVSFRPGFTFLNDAMPMGLKPYGIVGYRHLELEASGGGFGDEDFNGLELGIGAEFLAYGDFGVRLDYTHVWYGSEGGIDPEENNLRLGVAYHF